MILLAKHDGVTARLVHHKGVRPFLLRKFATDVVLFYERHRLKRGERGFFKTVFGEELTNVFDELGCFFIGKPIAKGVALKIPGKANTRA